MCETPMGDGAPKGFEGYFNDGRDRDRRSALRITCSTLSQLSDKEVAELDALRQRALDNYESASGDHVERRPIREELGCVPGVAGLAPSDKLVFRSYDGDELIAYADVACGWPRPIEWTVLQLLLDPAHRLKGVGSALIGSIERLARTAEVRATSILSLPTRDGATSFWEHLGYADKTSELADEVHGSVVTVMRKEL